MRSIVWKVLYCWLIVMFHPPPASHSKLAAVQACGDTGASTVLKAELCILYCGFRCLRRHPLLVLIFSNSLNLSGAKVPWRTPQMWSTLPRRLQRLVPGWTNWPALLQIRYCSFATPFLSITVISLIIQLATVSNCVIVTGSTADFELK